MSTASAQTARQPVAVAIDARLRQLDPARITVYDGEPTVPDTIDGGLVAPYAIVWGAGGRPDRNPNLGATSGGPQRLGDVLLTGQITFAAGSRNALLALLDLAVPHLHLWTPEVPGLMCGRLRQQDGFDPGQPRRDNNTRPARWMTPWMWTLHVTSSTT